MANARDSLNIPQSQRIEGIYDLRTLKSLVDKGVTNFAFDFRPKSFNFLQQHRFFDILKQAYSPLHRYFLIYENEKDFVVKKMLDDLNTLSHELFALRGMSTENFILDFRGKEEQAYVDALQWPFHIQYSRRSGLRALLNSGLCRGVSLPFEIVSEAHYQGRFSNLVSNFSQMVHSAHHGIPLDVVLCCDWDSNIFPSLFEFMDITCLALPVNSKVEVCYRNVDLGKMHEQLRYLTRSP